MQWRPEGWLLVLFIGLTSCITQVETQFAEDCPNADDCGPGYQLAAGAEGSDFVGFNVVVTDSPVTRARLLGIGSGYAERHPEKRVVVAFFGEGAGQERQAIEEGMLPEDSEVGPVPPSVADHWLGTLDFPAGATTPVSSQFSDRVAP